METDRKKSFSSSIERAYSSILILPHLPDMGLDSNTKFPVGLDKNFAKIFKHNILVAEDNPLNQKLIEKVLLKLGYKPKIVSNGKEAVEAVLLEHFDIVLMDLQMPMMDGIEATKLIIQQVESNNQPAIVALTANVVSETKDKCYKAGMRDFMTKPLQIEQLAEILRKHP